jgi:capsular exopolysaccharide synthesis family protein
MRLLATIPKVKSSKIMKKVRKGLYITDKSTGFAFTESYKALRTKIEMVAEKKGYKSFIITSSLENEGKTTVAFNLSVALAGNGRKVLLIDADLRKPSLYKFIGRSNNPPEVGISNVLRGDATYESAIMEVKEFGISVLTNVNELANTSELLSTSQMKNLIARASEKYDFVIIDSPPASILTDSIVITTYTDAVIMTERQDHASVQLIESVAENLSGNKADFIGCIFNIVDDQGFDYGKHSYWYYGKYSHQENNMRPTAHI